MSCRSHNDTCHACRASNAGIYTDRIQGLTDRERYMLDAAIDHYVADIRRACLEDQGTADGKCGTVGHGAQYRYSILKERLRSL